MATARALPAPREKSGSPEPAQIVMQLACGFMTTAALATVTRAGIADLLKDGRKPVSKLAREAKVNEDALYRILRALASTGVFKESAHRTFGLTPAAETLCRGAGSLRDMVLWMGERCHHETYVEMPHALKTGETVTEKVYGLSCFDFLETNQAVSEVFNAAMTSFSAVVAPEVLKAYDFSWLGSGTLVDVGGGHGYLLGEILKKYPKARGVVYDLEHVAGGARARIDSLGLAGRCTAATGSFFKSVPAGDAYIMKHILHDWADAKALAILKHIHRAARGPARVILIESVIAPGNQPHLAKWIDLEMLLLPGGRERTEEEFRELFQEAGFRLTGVTPTGAPLSVIEAVKEV